RLATFAGDDDSVARSACNTLSQCTYLYHWHAGPEALTVKTTVPTLCTPPSRKSAPQAPPYGGAWFGGCQPQKHRSRCGLKRHDDEFYLQSTNCRRARPQKLPRRDEPRRGCAGERASHGRAGRGSEPRSL